MTQTIKISDVANMAKDANCINIMKAVFAAMAYEKTIREIVEPIQNEVINFFKFEIPAEDRHGKDAVITNRRDLFLISDEDLALYMAETNAKYKAAGIAPENPEHCPLLVAECMTRDAWRVAIPVLEKYNGIGDVILGNLSAYKEYQSIHLKFFAKYM